MGFLSRDKGRSALPTPEEAAANYEPRTPNTELGPFDAYQSKSQFTVDWAADVFRQAGKDPAIHESGVADMATIAAFTQILYRLRVVAVSNSDRTSADIWTALTEGT